MMMSPTGVTVECGEVSILPTGMEGIAPIAPFFVLLPRGFQDFNSNHTGASSAIGKAAREKSNPTQNNHKNKEIREMGWRWRIDRSPLGTANPGTQPNSRWIHRMPDRTIEF